ncbi:Reticulocyte-binding protein 2 a [Vanrija pseudolonga]|uniref:Reticulocyte-binding protein 2 a n=1 Tax=Vanrija pseudolonga TaxID=143232 RepID=A0AAF0YDZ2_9TREE|nr:Reticulocyte-binding protein 2 a [Vanrija pseudolonga]
MTSMADTPTLTSTRSRSSMPPTPIGATPPSSPVGRVPVLPPLVVPVVPPPSQRTWHQSQQPLSPPQPQQQQQPLPPQQQSPRPPVYHWPVDTNLEYDRSERRSALYAAATDAEGFRSRGDKVATPTLPPYTIAARPVVRPPSGTFSAGSARGAPSRMSSTTMDHTPDQWREDVFRREEALARREEDITRREEQRIRREEVLGHREDVVARREESLGEREKEARRREEHLGAREEILTRAEEDVARQRAAVDERAEALAAREAAARSDPGHGRAERERSDLPYVASAVSMSELERSYAAAYERRVSADSRYDPAPVRQRSSDSRELEHLQLAPAPTPAQQVQAQYAASSASHRTYGPKAYATDDAAAIATAYAAATARAASTAAATLAVRSAPASRRQSTETLAFPTATPHPGYSSRVASVPLEAAPRPVATRALTLPTLPTPTATPMPTLYAPKPHHYHAHPPPILTDLLDSESSASDGGDLSAPPVPPRPTGPPSLQVWPAQHISFSVDAHARDARFTGPNRRTSASTDGSWSTRTPRPLSDLEDDDAAPHRDSVASQASNPPPPPQGHAPRGPWAQSNGHAHALKLDAVLADHVVVAKDAIEVDTSASSGTSSHHSDPPPPPAPRAPRREDSVPISPKTTTAPPMAVPPPPKAPTPYPPPPSPNPPPPATPPTQAKSVMGSPPAPSANNLPAPRNPPAPPAPPTTSAIARGLTRLGAAPRGRRPAPPSQSSRST